MLRGCSLRSLVQKEPGGRWRAAGRVARVSATDAVANVARGAAVWTLPVLVASAQGYRHLCRVITRAKLRSPKGEAGFTFDDFAGQTAGLIALVGREETLLDDIVGNHDIEASEEPR